MTLSYNFLKISTLFTVLILSTTCRPADRVVERDELVAAVRSTLVLSASSDLASFEEFYKVIGYSFRNPTLLQLAVTHNSDDLGTTLSLRGNERLELSGDALLDFGLRVVLWRKTPVSLRSNLPLIYSDLSANTTLARICDHIGLDHLAEFPPVSVLPLKSPRRDPLLDAKADRVEALVGALFLDSGRNIDLVFSFIERLWFSDGAAENFTEKLISLEGERKAEEELGYKFKDNDLFQSVLKEPLPLDFLGHGLLKFIMIDFLYHRFPALPEGDLTKRSQTILAKRNYPNFPSLKRSSGVAADIVGLVGGIYLDGGLEAVKNFVLWHWANPMTSEEVQVVLMRGPSFPISETVTILPPTIRGDMPPKTLLLELLHSIDVVPDFTTEPLVPVTDGFSSAVSFCSIRTVAAIAAQKREAEKIAAEKGLDELALTVLLDADMMSLSFPIDLCTKALEIATRKFFSSNFSYHLIAAHPQARKYRFEVQGSEFPSTIVEGDTVEEAKLKAIAAFLNDCFKEEWRRVKTATSPVLVLPEPLKLYASICSRRLGLKEAGFELKPISKVGGKLTPLLTYEITLPSYGITSNGQGYSRDIAELDCMIGALQRVEERRGTVLAMPADSEAAESARK